MIEHLNLDFKINEKDLYLWTTSDLFSTGSDFLIIIYYLNRKKIFIIIRRKLIKFTIAQYNTSLQLLQSLPKIQRGSFDL